MANSTFGSTVFGSGGNFNINSGGTFGAAMGGNFNIRFAPVPLSDLVEAGGIETDVDGGAQLVVMKKADFVTITGELAKRMEEGRSLKTDMGQLKDMAEDTATVVNTITTALSIKFGLVLEEEVEEEDEQEETHHEEEVVVSRGRPPRASVVPLTVKASQTGSVTPVPQKTSVVPLTVKASQAAVTLAPQKTLLNWRSSTQSEPKRSGRQQQVEQEQDDDGAYVDVLNSDTDHRTSTPQKNQLVPEPQAKRRKTGARSNGGPSKEKKADKNEVDRATDVAAQKKRDKETARVSAEEKKKKAKELKGKSRRVLTPLLGGGGYMVSWVLDSKGYVTLDTADLQAKAQQLLGGVKMTSKKMAKMWQAAAAGDDPTVVSDLAVGLVTHVAMTLLGDVANSGAVVLLKDIPEEADTEAEFLGLMPEPIRTAMRYVIDTCFVGDETEQQRMDLLEDVARSVKPYIDVIRKGEPFPQ